MLFRSLADACPPNGHGLGAALHRRALGLTSRDVVAVHPLARRDWAPSERGGARGGADPDPPGGGARWESFETWAALRRDEPALEQYMRARSRVLNNLELDWSGVLAQVAPHLSENREYVGLASLAPGAGAARPGGAGAGPPAPPRVQVTSMTAAPGGLDTSGARKVAEVDADLVEAVASRPALFLWHTHPAAPQASPLPSPSDISKAVTMAYAGMYAANVVISRYGVILYTLKWGTYQRIHSSPDPEQAMRHFRYDVASFFSTLRSWAAWTLDDYRAAFDRYGLIFVVYPSPEYVAASQLAKFKVDLLEPTNFELLDRLREEVVERRRGRRAPPPRGGGR